MKKILLALSLSGALFTGSAVWAENTSEPTKITTEQATIHPATTPETIPSETATPIESPTVEATIDSGDTAWILISTALVLMMTIPGLASI